MTANRFADVKGIEELIGTTIGAGSMCWENVNAAGAFDSTTAANIMREAVERLSQLLGEGADSPRAECSRARAFGDEAALRWRCADCGANVS